MLVGYASMIRALADEQLAGRLHITPRAVNSSSEVLTGEARAMATRTWKIAPFNVYAATETGGIAAECAQHRGLHPAAAVTQSGSTQSCSTTPWTCSTPPDGRFD